MSRYDDGYPYPIDAEDEAGYADARADARADRLEEAREAARDDLADAAQCRDADRARASRGRGRRR